MSSIRIIALAAALPLIAGAPSAAHHSGAMFEPTLQMELRGEIREFRWSNPHAWIEIDVAGEDGESQMWAVEMTAPNNLARTGWNRRTLQAGDQVVLTVRPLRDGQPGGTFVRVTTPDGTEMPPRVEAAAPEATAPEAAPAAAGEPPTDGGDSED
jgi:hypothetical protein